MTETEWPASLKYLLCGPLRKFPGYFLGGLVVKTLPSNGGGVGLIPGQGAKIPHASQPKHQNIKKIEAIL